MREMSRSDYVAAKALLAHPALSEATLRMIKRDLDPEFTRAARVFQHRCVHCGCHCDDRGYAHAPACPVAHEEAA